MWKRSLPRGSHTNLDTNLVKAPPRGAAKVASAIAMQIDDMRTITLVANRHCFGNLRHAESEDSAGARRMPWRRKPKKGAASRDSPRGGAHGLRSGGARMGEPDGGHAPSPAPESIGGEEATRGTETSKYPEEEKSTEIAPVAASERARCPNHGARHSFGALGPWGCGGRTSGGPRPRAR